MVFKKSSASSSKEHCVQKQMKKDRWDDIQILLGKKQWKMMIKSQRPLMYSGSF